MNVLIPIAGQETFFESKEYVFPKALVEIDGKPMIHWVVENLRQIAGNVHFTFVAPRNDVQRYTLDEIFRLLTDDNFNLVSLADPTAGALCSSLLAINLIDPDEPLVISNGDQIIETDLRKIVEGFQRRDLDAGVITFDSVHPRWSYVRTDDNDMVIEAAEKRVISSSATMGFYYFKRGGDFIQAAMRSLMHGQVHDGKYYISPCLNYLVLDGARVGHTKLASDRYHSFYSPRKIADFERILQRRQISIDTGQLKAPCGEQLTVVIPAAGAGSRFVKAGYSIPKPFINVRGKPMLARVLDNLHHPNANYLLPLRQEHLDGHSEIVEKLVQQYNVQIVPVTDLTEGTACTVLLARKQIPSNCPLVVANSDQLVDFKFEAFVEDCLERKLDGSVLVFKDEAMDPKWSFVRLDNQGLLLEVQEKKPISNLATVGIYMFSRAEVFFDAAIDMIAANDRVNNEFYTCPVYNYALKNKARIGVYEVSHTTMHGLGTPEDLDQYLAQHR